MNFLMYILLFTVLMSFLLEKLIKPYSQVLSLKNVLLQTLIITLEFLTLLLIVQRPIFSCLIILISLTVIISINNIKYKILREPVVFTDFFMFSQAFKHPRLYFPFIGVRPILIAVLIIPLSIYMVLKLEKTLDITPLLFFSMVIAIGIILSIIKALALGLPLKNKPHIDNKIFGLQNSILSYALHARAQKQKLNFLNTVNSSTFNRKEHEKEIELKPNITVVQSESFFDIRQLHSSINPEVLHNFDVICSQSIQYGKLTVPAWGANTMRTEFSFLTGLPNEALGLYRYYPYYFANKFSVASLSSSLQEQGYHCICIHPYPKTFFNRDKMFPNFGFDEFVDINGFDKVDKCGPYVSDDSVANKIIEMTNKYKLKPLFIFAITMENHGPYHLEKTTRKEEKAYYNDKLLSTKSLNELTVYLRHLKNADKMVKKLTDQFDNAKEENIFCFYGDHVPSLPEVYEYTNFNDFETNYFVWKSRTNKPAEYEKLGIECLASKIIFQCSGE